MPHAPWPFTWPAGSIHGSATSQKAYDVDSKPFDGGLHPHGKSEAVHRDQQGVLTLRVSMQLSQVQFVKVFLHCDLTM